MLGPDCIKMATTAMQKRMDGPAAARCQFEQNRLDAERSGDNYANDVLRGVELRANEQEVRACLANSSKCKRLVDEAVVLSEGCSSYAFWAADDEQLTDPRDISAREEARTLCTLELNYVTGKTK